MAIVFGQTRSSIYHMSMFNRGNSPLKSFAVFAIVASLGLTGCSHFSLNHKDSKNSDIGAGDKDSSSFTKLDSKLVSGYEKVVLTNEAKKVKAETLRVKEAHNLSIANDVVMNKYLRLAHLGKAGSADIKASIIAASPDVIGVAYYGKFGGISDKNISDKIPATVWYDATRGQVFSGSALIDWPKWQEFFNVAYQAAAEKKLDLDKFTKAMSASAAPYGNGPAYGFNSEGDMILAFPSKAISDDVVELVLPREKVALTLSVFGQYALSASLKPSEFSGKPSMENPAFEVSKGAIAPEKSPNLNPLVDNRKPLFTKLSEITLFKPRSSEKESSGSQAPKVTHPSTAVGVDCIANKCAVLTYDDGPGPDSPKLLSYLDEAQVPATFFELGNSIKTHRAISLELATAGMEIGSHSLTHPPLSKVSAEVAAKEISGNSKLLEEVIGRKPLIFRPPYGAHNAQVDKIIGENGMSVIQWLIDTNDWNKKITHKDPALVTKEALKIGENDWQPIILMHDVHPSSVAAAPTVISGLKERGYQIVTVMELSLNTGGLKTGKGYCRGSAYTQPGAPSWCAG